MTRNGGRSWRSWRTALALLLLAGGAPTNHAQVLFESEFETPVVPAGKTELVLPTGTAVDGWTVESGSVSVIATGAVPGNGAQGQSLRLKGTDPGTIAVDLVTEPGARYEVFLRWGTNGKREQDLAAELLWNTAIAGQMEFRMRATNFIGNFEPVFPPPDSHGQISAVVEGTGRDRLTIRSTSGTGYFIDGIQVTRVHPETPVTPPQAFLVPQGPVTVPLTAGAEAIPQPDRFLDEGFPLNFQVIWPQPPEETQFLFMKMLAGPPGAQLFAVGSQAGRREWWFYWVPSETEGGNVYRMEFEASAWHFPGQRWAATFQLHVRDSSVPPVIDGATFARAEGEPLDVVLTGHDDDQPAQPLRWALVDAPAGVSLEPATGRLQWIPGEADGPRTNWIRVALTEDIPHGLTTAATIPVAVTEVNRAPSLPAAPDIAVVERRTLQFPLPGEDPDLPAQKLTYTLLSGPEGLVLEPATGVVYWTPTEAQGGAAYTIAVKVTDDGTPPLTAEGTYRIVVAKGNSAPLLARIPDVRMAEGERLDFLLPGSDSDLPPQTLTYSVLDGPPGLVVEPATGRLTWTPDESTGGKSFRVTVAVSDDADPPLAISRFFTVTVDESNQPPAIAEVSDVTAPPFRELRIPVTATDPDVPTNRLTLDLAIAPAGAVIVDGEFRWTPSEPATTSRYPITVRVRDDGSPSREALRRFDIIVPAEAPGLRLTEPEAGTTIDERFALAGEATDNGRLARVAWRWNGIEQNQLAIDADGRFRLDGLRLFPGENQIAVMATDTAGLTTTTDVVRAWSPLRTFALNGGGTVTEGVRVSLPVMLESGGDVASATLRVTYDPEVFADPEWEWLGAAAGAFHGFDIVAPGTLGATFALGGAALPAGSTSIARLTFRARSVPAARDSQLTLEALDLADPAGNALRFGTDANGAVVRVGQRAFAGDNNGNGRLDSGDAAVIQHYVIAPELARAWDVTGNDLNANGAIDAGDALKVLRVAVGLDAPPAGSSSPGGTPGSARYQFQPTSTTARPGDVVNLDLLLDAGGNPIVGGSFVIEYPVEALRLAGRDAHALGGLVPAATSLVLWNLEPAGDDYARQTGRLRGAIASSLPWPARSGTLVRLRFQVSSTATAGEHTVRVVTPEVSLRDGYEQQSAFGASASLTIEVPPPVPLMFTDIRIFDGEVLLTVSGPPGPVRLDSSFDLVHWDEGMAFTLEDHPVTARISFDTELRGLYWRLRRTAP